MSKAELYYGARKSQKVEHNLSVLHRCFETFRSLAFSLTGRPSSTAS